jgi:hypothetical protein
VSNARRERARRAQRPGRRWLRTTLWVVGALVVVFIVVQLIPYGRSSHTNPPATNAFAWTDPAAEAIAKESCYDCHSNQTKWWWATDVAPFSWLVQHDVDGGRSRLNFSEFAGLPSAESFQRVIEGGEMPQIQYTLLHPSAKLTDAEKQTLVQGYAAGLAASGSSSDGQAQGSPAPTASPTSAAAADATTIINQRCGSCHSPDPALQFRAGSSGEAQALIDAMKQRGAQLTAAEEQALIAYYTR